MRFNMKHLLVSGIFRIFAPSIRGGIFFKDWQDKFNQLKVKTDMTIAKFKSDETRNNTEYILECIKAALRNYPYDTEYQVDITITTDYGYYFHTTLEFYRGDKTFFDGNVFVCEEYIKIHTIPQYQASVRGKIINATHQFRKSDIERHISDWLN